MDSRLILDTFKIVIHLKKDEPGRDQYDVHFLHLVRDHIPAFDRRGFLFFKILRLKELKKEVEIQFQNLENRTNSLHLENLESKLNPHLFKNILNSIQSHAYQTYFALDKLANVLDYILYESRGKFVTPKDEIEFALNLIEINKIKLSPLFDLKIKKKINEFDPLFNKPVLAPLNRI